MTEIFVVMYRANDTQDWEPVDDGEVILAFRDMASALDAQELMVLAEMEATLDDDSEEGEFVVKKFNI